MKLQKKKLCENAELSLNIVMINNSPGFVYRQDGTNELSVMNECPVIILDYERNVKPPHTQNFLGVFKQSIIFVIIA